MSSFLVGGVVFCRYNDTNREENPMNIDYKLIGDHIKKERKSKGMTQEVLAEKLNVSIGYVSQVERGITKISLDLLGAISTILNCNIAALISESAINSSEYIESELVNEILKLDSKKRKHILEILRIINENF